jgi:hypothetical protein
VQLILRMAQVQGEAEIGGGSDRNRALLGNQGNSVRGMQVAQSPINTGDRASR